jgi:hypothetical protein
VGGMEREYNIMIETPEGKKQSRRPRHKWEENAEIYLK